MRQVERTNDFFAPPPCFRPSVRRTNPAKLPRLAIIREAPMPKRLRLLTASICALSAALAVVRMLDGIRADDRLDQPFSSGSTISEVDRAYLQAAGSWDTQPRQRRDLQRVEVLRRRPLQRRRRQPRRFPRSHRMARTSQTSTRCSSPPTSSTSTPTATAKSRAHEFVDKPNPAFVLMDKAGNCKLNANQIASARSKTEYDLSGSKPQNSDPREQGGQQGQAANGALPGQ